MTNLNVPIVHVEISVIHAYKATMGRKNGIICMIKKGIHKYTFKVKNVPVVDLRHCGITTV